MAHLHTQIRNAVVTALTGLATSGARVYANRLYAMGAGTLPGLRVSTDTDDVQIESIHAPALQAHSLAVVVECCAAANSGLDDACDQMQLEVEAALAAGIAVGATTLYPILTGSRYDDEPAATPAGVKRVEFVVQYHALSTTPDTLA